MNVVYVLLSPLSLKNVRSLVLKVSTWARSVLNLPPEKSVESVTPEAKTEEATEAKTVNATGWRSPTQAELYRVSREARPPRRVKGL